MDRVASFGLSAYWDIKKGEARNIMQEELKNKYQFFRSLVEINKVFGDNRDFIIRVKEELFSDNIYVYTPKGDIVQLPKGATPIDLAYEIDTNLGNMIDSAIVNDEVVDVNYILKNKDRVRIITNNLSLGPKEEWESIVKTTKAKMKIREFNGKDNKNE